ncbi:hypothetical protein G6F46_012410 [Rhizopus delemar]|uniref:Endonuclease/exonuclease/phosphatase domain-containing protein n=2 Tax=Rhizopus TaxID=4842 RepID=A0A9P7CHC0_9FUNG|nr:hypothetical protein G6F55_012149 [Rhizopus delemar]KAG1533439.1 hypothetical protein G6F51_012614 [Rhizopus arrhizus]KAG1487400.1 hypothetical protein G6F54_012684 [Rhizopus delemar]KAG1495511.1 hypothetical protein G6F53_012363 [Rhizopus delemar]KAG1501860.1 hypothetical protein G6F52_012420 [Rhizopus delemar]
MPTQSTPSNNYTNTLNMTIWNANGCARHAISAITDAMPNTSLLFMVETWLLSPLQYPTPWGQYHTYVIPVEGNPRGQMGISLFVHPDCPYPVTHFPSTSPYVLSCQVSTLLIHCVYFPPALSDAEALDILTDLPYQIHPSQTNTIFCDDFNARLQAFLGDSRSNTRGTMLYSWLVEHGLICWNAELAYGVPTYCAHNRVGRLSGQHFQSIIDLFLSSQQLIAPRMVVHEDLSLGSHHCPVTLSCLLLPPPPQSAHPRLLWHLSRLPEPDCLYGPLFKERIKSFNLLLLDLVSPFGLLTNVRPDIDDLVNQFTSIIHSCLDDSVGKKTPCSRGNTWFWTANLQASFDYREQCRRQWRRACGINKGLRWQTYSSGQNWCAKIFFSF